MKNRTNYENIFAEILEELKNIPNSGEVASYIPELAHIDPHLFGVNLTTVASENFAFGDWNIRFSIQSIAKVFSFVLAYSLTKSDIWTRMDLEPAGTAFNSLVH